ncbi:MAG: hypothetical protein ACXVKI_04965, partial [Flavisolibacter sp.]
VLASCWKIFGNKLINPKLLSFNLSKFLLEIAKLPASVELFARSWSLNHYIVVVFYEPLKPTFEK